MKKNMSIDEKLKEVEAQKRRLVAFSEIMNKCSELIQWSYMDIKRDENNDAVHDDNGELVYIEPSEGDFRYESYIAMKSAIEEIVAII